MPIMEITKETAWGLSPDKESGMGRAIHLYPGELLDQFDSVVEMLKKEAEENGWDFNSVVRTPKLSNGLYDASSLVHGPTGEVPMEIVEYRFIKK